MKKYALTMFIMYYTLPVSAQMDHVTFLRPPLRIPIGYYLGHIQVQDFDGDGKTDLVGVLIDDNRSPGSSHQSVRIWRNLSDQSKIRFDAPQEYGGRTETGILEILAREGEEFIVIENLSNLDEIRFNEHVHGFSIGRDSRIAVLADMSGDNRQEFVCINHPGKDSDGTVIVLVRD